NEAWGQAVIVENRPGAGGNIGTEAVAKAAADGYTLSLVPSSHAIAPLFYPKLPFDVFKDFTFITLVASGPNIVVVNPAVSATSVADLVALAQQKPGELTFASAGVGSSTHLAGEYFNSMAGPITPHHDTDSYGNPDSSTVGTLGSAGKRCLPVVAIA